MLKTRSGISCECRQLMLTYARINMCLIHQEIRTSVASFQINPSSRYGIKLSGPTCCIQAKHPELGAPLSS